MEGLRISNPRLRLDAEPPATVGHDSVPCSEIIVGGEWDLPQQAERRRETSSKPGQQREMCTIPKGRSGGVEPDGRREAKDSGHAAHLVDPRMVSGAAFKPAHLRM